MTTLNEPSVRNAIQDGLPNAEALVPKSENIKIQKGYTTRWRQRRKPTKDNPSIWRTPVTGSRIYGEDELELLMETCSKVNMGFGGDIEQWPVKWHLGKKGQKVGEFEDMRYLVGLDTPVEPSQVPAGDEKELSGLFPE